MSDGPYKSLPMNNSWKDVAERAHKASFSEEEREQSMCVALRKDVLRDVGTNYINAIGEILIDQEQGNLLADQVAVEFENITNRFSQSPLRDHVSANIQAALYLGKSGEDALVQGINLAVQDHGQGRNRQVEEHYKRDARTFSEHQKTNSVRESLARTLGSPSIANLGLEIAGLVRGQSMQTRLLKASGLDDGPRIG